MNSLFVHDMVQNNPGLEKYESAYNQPKFLKKRSYAGKVFDLFECAQFALEWKKLDTLNPQRDRVFPEGSSELNWVRRKYGELKEEYLGMAAAGIEVFFMMDIIVLPKRILDIYPEILNKDGNIDICSSKMKEILEVLFEEMFERFPEISGIYVRYGETYVGEKFFTPYHCGNNPILAPKLHYHEFLMNFMRDTVCCRYGKKVFYRTWGFGSFQYEPEEYLSISGRIAAHPLFYFCVKHTEGDFHRNYPFNRCLNIGKHQQVVEVQAAREYEGKGAFPNYIADGVINGFEELKWKMKTGQPKCLSDVLTGQNSLIKGMWIWSRGGGWGGPYINGRNDEDSIAVIDGGSELWADVNAYVLSHWAMDMSRSEQFYALQYAKQELGMNGLDAWYFYSILKKSSLGVLLGRGTDIEGLEWDVFWTRDQNIDSVRLQTNIRNAIKAGCLDILMEEKAESLNIWKEIVETAEKLSKELPIREYIVTTCKYGYCLFSLFESMYRANAMKELGNNQEVYRAVADYDRFWEAWESLYQNSRGCPTLYAKEDKALDMGGYTGNRGLDGAISFLRERSEKKETV